MRVHISPAKTSTEKRSYNTHTLLNYTHHSVGSVRVARFFIVNFSSLRPHLPTSLLAHEIPAMSPYTLTPEESSMVAVMTIFGKDQMDSLIALTDQNTKAAFGRLFISMQSINMMNNMTNVLLSSVATKQIAIWDAIRAAQAAISHNGFAEALGTAAEILVKTWPAYPKSGFEKPLDQNVWDRENRRRCVCNTLMRYARILVKSINIADESTQDQCQIYSFAALYSKICW